MPRAFRDEIFLKYVLKTSCLIKNINNLKKVQYINMSTS